MLTMEQIQLKQAEPIKDGKGGYFMRQPVPYESNVALIGVDPGVSYGVAEIRYGFLQLHWGKLPGTKLPKGHRAIQAMEFFTEEGKFDLYWDAVGVVEGAAYNKKFGQVGLEEVRIGFYLGLVDVMGDNVHIVPPSSIKAKVLGSAKNQAGDWWPWLNHNAADAISIALYGQYIKE